MSLIKITEGQNWKDALKGVKPYDEVSFGAGIFSAANGLGQLDAKQFRGVRLVGEGPDKTQIVGTGSRGVRMKEGDFGDITFEGLSFDGTNAGASVEFDAENVIFKHVRFKKSGNGLVLYGKNILAEGCDFRLNNVLGLYISNSKLGVDHNLGRHQNIEIRESFFTQNAIGEKVQTNIHGGSCKFIPSCEGIYFRYNVMNDAQGVWFDASHGGHEIIGNTIFSHTNFEVWVEPGKVKQSGRNPFFFEITSYNEYLREGGPERTIVRDNYFVTDRPQGTHGGYISASAHVTFENNVCVGPIAFAMANGARTVGDRKNTREIYYAKITDNIVRKNTFFTDWKNGGELGPRTGNPEPSKLLAKFRGIRAEKEAEGMKFVEFGGNEPSLEDLYARNVIQDNDWRPLSEWQGWETAFNQGYGPSQAPATVPELNGKWNGYEAPDPDPNPDLEKPTAPSGLIASAVTSSSLLLTWNPATDNVGVDQYSVYQNGVKIGQSVDTSFVVQGLSANSEYDFVITAEDRAGNVSSFSNEITVQTEREASGDAIDYPKIKAIFREELEDFFFEKFRK
jgi:hypothetical protein